MQFRNLLARMTKAQVQELNHLVQTIPAKDLTSSEALLRQELNQEVMSRSGQPHDVYDPEHSQYD